MASDGPQTRNPSLVEYMVWATVCVVFWWVWFAVENYFGINHKWQRIAPGDALPVWFPMAMTLTTYIGAYVFYRRARSFLSRATPATAKIVAIGLFEIHGMRNVTYSYQIAHRTFERKRSVAALLLKDLSPGDDVAILVDRSSPGQSYFAAEF